MRKSLRFKMTLWFTILLLLISGVMIYVMVTAFRYYDEKDAQTNLRETVEKLKDRFEDSRPMKEAVEADRKDFFSEKDFLLNDVQLMIYHDDGQHSVGIFAHDSLDQKEFEDGEVRKSELDGRNYYILDLHLERRHGENFWIRGITAAGSSTAEIIGEHATVLFLVPLFIIIGAVGGFWLISRFLKPVRLILQTSEEIRDSGDLSKRIRIPEKGDEFNRIADGFNAMLVKLEDNFEAEKRFASNASHELRTPVAVILAQCDYAFENAKDMQEMYETVESIQRQGYRMSKLIEMLLIFTRIDQSTEKYPLEETELSGLIRSLGEDFELIRSDRHFEYRLQESVFASVNRELFSLLATNLIQNAIRYGKENGLVRLDLSQRDGQVVFSVTDDGIGIEEKDLPHIWERFYRGEQSRSTKGTGLGLSLVWQIARYHGGKLQVVSQPGMGSTFTYSQKTVNPF